MQNLVPPLNSAKSSPPFKQCKIPPLNFIETRLLGRFAPIFFFYREHFLFLYIVKQKTKKVRGFYKKKFRGFSKFNENSILMQVNFEILIVHKPSLEAFEVPQKIIIL